MIKHLNIRRLILLTILILTTIPLSAQRHNTLDTSNSQGAYLVAFACEGTNCAGKTIDATAGGITLTSANYNPVVTDQPAGFSQAQTAVCYNTGAKIWVTSNSTITLSSGKGLAILDGGSFTIYGFASISTFKAIRDAAVSSTLYCDYLRQP